MDPQPYQTGDGTWSTETKEGQDEAEGEREGHEGKWFLHKKHRQMAKLELVDAFELRKLVIAILVGSAAVVLLVGVWVSRVALTRFWQ